MLSTWRSLRDFRARRAEANTAYPWRDANATEHNAQLHVNLQTAELRGPFGSRTIKGDVGDHAVANSSRAKCVRSRRKSRAPTTATQASSSRPDQAGPSRKPRGHFSDGTAGV